MTTDNDTTTISNVLVFKTNISSEAELQILTKVLALENKISRWNVDRNDIDKVLRIEAEKVEPAYIINLICDAGFLCEELPD